MDGIRVEDHADLALQVARRVLPAGVPARDSWQHQLCTESLWEAYKGYRYNPARARDPVKGFRAYAGTVMRNRLIDAHRAMIRRRETDEGLSDIPSPRDPIHDFQVKEEVDRLLGFLSSGHETLRLMFERRFYDNLSYSQLASEFGICLGTVKSRMHAAYKILRARAGERTLAEILGP